MHSLLLDRASLHGMEASLVLFGWVSRGWYVIEGMTWHSGTFIYSLAFIKIPAISLNSKRWVFILIFGSDWVSPVHSVGILHLRTVSAQAWCVWNAHLLILFAQSTMQVRVSGNKELKAGFSTVPWLQIPVCVVWSLLWRQDEALLSFLGI